MNQFEKFVLYRQSCSVSVMCLKSEITIQISESVEIKEKLNRKEGDGVTTEQGLGNALLLHCSLCGYDWRESQCVHDAWVYLAC